MRKFTLNKKTSIFTQILYDGLQIKFSVIGFDAYIKHLSRINKPKYPTHPEASASSSNRLHHFTLLRSITPAQF